MRPAIRLCRVQAVVVSRSAPKLAYNAPVRERQRKTDETEGQYRKKTSALPRSGLQAPVFKSKRYQII